MESRGLTKNTLMSELTTSRADQLRLTDLSADLFNTIIFPALSVADMSAFMLTCKSAHAVVGQYDGYKHIVDYDFVFDIDRIQKRVGAESLVTKFPQILLKLATGHKFINDVININNIAANLLELQCNFLTIHSASRSMPNLQKLSLTSRTILTHSTISRCMDQRPALKHIHFYELKSACPMRFCRINTLMSISISFNNNPCEIYIQNLPNLKALYLSSDRNFKDLEYIHINIQYADMLYISEVPNLSTLCISNYNTNFDITQLHSLQDITLDSVNYISGSNIGLYKIDFNAVFPYLLNLYISNSSSINNGWRIRESVLGDISNLDRLILVNNNQLAGIGNLTKIGIIAISDCERLATIQSVQYVDRIQVYNCSVLNRGFYKHCVGIIQI